MYIFDSKALIYLIHENEWYQTLKAVPFLLLSRFIQIPLSFFSFYKTITQNPDQKLSIIPQIKLIIYIYTYKKNQKRSLFTISNQKAKYSKEDPKHNMNLLV